MTRAWQEDVLRCRRCGGDVRLVAVILDHTVAEKILRHVGRWNRALMPDP